MVPSASPITPGIPTMLPTTLSTTSHPTTQAPQSSTSGAGAASSAGGTSSLSAGAVGGISIAVIIAVGGAALAAFLLYRKSLITNTFRSESTAMGSIEIGVVDSVMYDSSVHNLVHRERSDE
jgi:hypothetical protein